MTAPVPRPNSGCDAIAAEMGRVALDGARRDHLAALRDAIMLGVPLVELALDCEAAAKAMRDVLALAGEGTP